MRKFKKEKEKVALKIKDYILADDSITECKHLLSGNLDKVIKVSSSDWLIER